MWPDPQGANLAFHALGRFASSQGYGPTRTASWYNVAQRVLQACIGERRTCSGLGPRMPGLRHTTAELLGSPACAVPTALPCTGAILCTTSLHPTKRHVKSTQDSAFSSSAHIALCRPRPRRRHVHGVRGVL